jgi:predicted ATPase
VAVTLGAEGQGVVAGDLVNTASRVQVAAEPGSVLVGEIVRRASEAAIVYEDAGSFELKGKSERVRLWLFHASAEQGRAHLLSVVGIAGIGKSRLAWELYKHVDGLARTVYWHHGRCLAYGEGVAYSALAEMVRMRCLIPEDVSPIAGRERLRATLAELMPEAEEREWVEPRLAHLLGLEERQDREREDLFGAWRLFFERVAGRGPVVLAFEDVQWADAALLEFAEYLLDWSRNHEILVLALARPELADRHPGWPGSARNATTLALEPLPDGAIAALLEGLVPGLPEEVRARVLARAEGVPLYAVETVRMLLDGGLLAREGDVFQPTGPLDSLAVPETLHALAAARLDGLGLDERLVLQDAAVLGKAFTRAGLAAVSGKSEAELEPLLAFLVRREILGLQTDPRSPEREWLVGEGRSDGAEPLIAQARETFRGLRANPWLDRLAALESGVQAEISV